MRVSEDFTQQHGAVTHARLQFAIDFTDPAAFVFFLVFPVSREALAQEMYRYLAIANYEDRFVVPSSHRELAREAFPEKNGCGFTFGDGCHGSDTKFNLFNSRRIDAIDVTSKTEPHP
jgi:hypothetical protein